MKASLHASAFYFYRGNEHKQLAYKAKLTDGLTGTQIAKAPQRTEEFLASSFSREE